MASLHVKIATEPWEFEQIHALNHKTFVEEIPRYESREANRLMIAFTTRTRTSSGCMTAAWPAWWRFAIAGRSRSTNVCRISTPISLPGRSMCELRLLAVERQDRMGLLLPALLDGVWRYCRQQRFDLALISGITRQLRLYRHLGFEPFGPVVGTPEAQFQPMMLTLERFVPIVDGLFRRVNEPSRRGATSFQVPWQSGRRC